LEYIEISFVNNQEQGEILMALLGDIGFDSFVESEEGLLAYCPEHLFKLNDLQETVSYIPILKDISYAQKLIPMQNWNQVWESNFEPIVIGASCWVRSTFHKTNPDYPLEVVIQPQMSFGTGHHETTAMVMEFLLESDCKEKKVIDVGCGTSILAILAEKLGASKIDAIDTDEWCITNSLENLTLNNSTRIQVAQSDIQSFVKKEVYDIILANITRNILLEDLPYYEQISASGTVLIMSGFIIEDVELIKKRCEACHFSFQKRKENGQWVSGLWIRE